MGIVYDDFEQQQMQQDGFVQQEQCEQQEGFAQQEDSMQQEQYVQQDYQQQGQQVQQGQSQQDDWDRHWILHTKWWLLIIVGIFIYVFATQLLLPALEPTEHKPSDLLTPHSYDGNILDDLLEGGDDLLNGR